MHVLSIIAQKCPKNKLNPAFMGIKNTSIMTLFFDD